MHAPRRVNRAGGMTSSHSVAAASDFPVGMPCTRPSPPRMDSQDAHELHPAEAPSVGGHGLQARVGGHLERSDP
eukprot:2757730-Alexandrium_andersonii.AAC.1